MPYVLLGDGGAKVWCMRVMPENATRAHAIVSLYYKADGDDVDVMKRKFRIKYTSRFVDPAKANGDITKQVITKEQVHDIEEIFFKHIKENFKHIKANHGDSYKENK